MHNEREMDRVLGIDGIELVGINNRDLGKFTLYLTEDLTIKLSTLSNLSFGMI